MDFFAILLISIIAFVGGVAFTLLIEFYIFERYLKSGPIAAPPPKKPIPHGKAQLPDELLTKIKQEKSGFGSHDENLAINLALQFLFNELRNSERVRLWLFKKLNNEFKEFVDQTITGKLFERIRLRDIHLGKNFPMIKGMEVADAKICADTGLLETLDLALDLHYSGNFQLSIDVDLFSKTAFLALQVKRVTGKARLQFTRVPYTHWSLSFYSEPILELEVQSQFHGRQLQSQVINIIINQIRKAVRRKHTLPHYKMRYKPFFRRLNDEDIDLSEVASTQLTPGTLDVTLIELSRLNVELNGTRDSSQIEIYCTMSIDYTPWVYLTQYGGIPYMVLDLIISKTSAQNFGVVFKREFVLEISQHCVMVETIVSGSPAAAAEMKRGDIIVAVNGKKVTGLTQVAKLIKSATQRRFIVRVERKYSKIDSERFKQDLDRISERDFDRKSSKSDVTIFSKESDSTDSGNVSIDRSRFEGIKFSDLKEPELDLAPERDSGYKLFRRKSSARTTEDLTQSPENTPTRKISTSSSLSNTSMGMFYNLDESMNTVAELFAITSEKTLAAVVSFDETKSFKVESEHQYLNVGVWARKDEQPPKLVGYINAPIKLVLAQCSTSSTGNYLKCQALLPPDTVSTTNTSKLHGYSGFDPTLCYGDILLSYTWSSSNPTQPILDTSNSPGNNSNNAKKMSEDAIKVQPILLGVESNDKKLHDFMRTHFHRATQCDFCSKKIWLKDAVQCRDCGMVCHKKCENRCQALNYCSADTLATLACEADEVETLVTGDSGPEISLTSCEENVQGASMMAVKASIANTLLGLKRAGSTSCLAPPNAGMGLASRSLPPSPCASRKSSLVGGLGISNELLEGADPSLVAPLVAGELSDGLMSKAKETGKYLFDHLQKEERIEKINSMIMKLNTALDTETTSRLELSQNGDNGKLITQSDLRVQTMSILLLHYCTGLQHAQKCSDGSPGNSQT